MERDGHDFYAEAESLLGWWRDAGVDTAVQEEPRDWLKPAPPPSSPANQNVIPAQAGISGRKGALSSPDPGLRRDDGEGASLPDQLALFHDWLRASAAVPLATPLAPRVCPSGDPASGLMVMTAMPSTEDCAAGMMLSGATGRLFDRMLAAIGRSRDTSYLAGLSCLRPAGGRLDPASAGRCAEIARHHLGLVAPKAVLLLGDACARALLGLGAAEARGKVHRIASPAGEIAAVVTLHPDYLLVQPAAKELAWADLQLLQETLA